VVNFAENHFVMETTELRKSVHRIINQADERF